MRESPVVMWWGNPLQGMLHTEHRRRRARSTIDVHKKRKNSCAAACGLFLNQDWRNRPHCSRRRGRGSKAIPTWASETTCANTKPSGVGTPTPCLDTTASTRDRCLFMRSKERERTRVSMQPTPVSRRPLYPWRQLSVYPHAHNERAQQSEAGVS